MCDCAQKNTIRRRVKIFQINFLTVFSSKRFWKKWFFQKFTEIRGFKVERWKILTSRKATLKITLRNHSTNIVIVIASKITFEHKRGETFRTLPRPFPSSSPRSIFAKNRKSKFFTLHPPVKFCYSCYDVVSCAQSHIFNVLILFMSFNYKRLMNGKCCKTFEIIIIYHNAKFHTVFFNLATGDIFNPAMIAISELKFPILKHSLAVSIQYSITRTRCFFFTCCKRK